MGSFIKNILNPATLSILSSNSNPTIIRDENVVQAVKGLLKAIKSLELYPEHQALIDRFEVLRKNQPALYTHRPFYLWQMSQAGFQIMSLNLPEPEFLRSTLLKCQAGLLTVLFDDICDLGDDKNLFHNAVSALNGEVHQNDSELYSLIADIWENLQEGSKQAPNYLLIKPKLEEAHQLWIASFEYSLKLRESTHPDIKWDEHLETIAHSAVLYIAGLTDLLFLPNLSENQLSVAASVFLRTQKMIEIANWATTWERELNQRDFTSGIFIMALQNGWIQQDDLKTGSFEKIREKIRNSPVEKNLWHEWEQLRVESHKIANDAQFSDLDEYINSLSVLMFIQIASTGLV